MEGKERRVVGKKGRRMEGIMEISKVRGKEERNDGREKEGREGGKGGWNKERNVGKEEERIFYSK